MKVIFNYNKSRSNIESVTIYGKGETITIDLTAADPLQKGCSKASIAANIRQCMHEGGRSQKQCVAIALSFARKQGCKISRKKKTSDEGKILTTKMLNQNLNIYEVWRPLK